MPKSVIDLVNDIEAENERKRRSEQDELQRRNLEQVATRTRVVSALIKILMEIHGYKSFTVERCHQKDQWGSVAVLKQRGIYIATFCVDWTTGLFRGSDESPEEEYQYLRVFLTHTVNGRDRYIDLSITHGTPEGIEKLSDDFRTELAKWVQKQRN